MKIVSSENFDSKGNKALNTAVRLANNTGTGEITCSHLMLALLEDTAIAEQFNKDTGVDTKRFVEALTFQCSSGYYGSNSDRELEINDVSDILDRAFHEMISVGRKAAHRVTLEMMYNVIMTIEGSEVYETLSALGIKREDVKISNTKENDPLSDMPNTANFASDMCKIAEKGGFDPIEDRDEIIDRVIEVLGRRQKGNPCLIGEPGVGKTAIIEGLAQKIAADDVPNYMKNIHILNVDISGILSGSKYRGEFEARMNSVLYEAASHKNVILFFDEFHMLMDAGTSNDGAMNAANILKPAISRGDVRIIGATTIKEYAKFVEGDGAFERRMQSILVEEPTIGSAIKMMHKVVPSYESYHKCKVSDDVIEAAVKLSDRYITDRKLPDKAITVIDETAARLKVFAPDDVTIELTVDDIRNTISKTTKIDVSEIDRVGKDKLQTLEENLRKRVIGQDKAITSVVKALRRAKAGIKDPNRPIGSFLMVGPTGVGKTELTKAVAQEFSGNIKNLVRFDMSEFQEKHTVSRLIGAPPGYIGFGNGGQLTEAVRHNQNSVVLFDEVEKAHPDIFNLLLQVLDDGILTDSNGIKVDFKNTVIVMTSNAGYGAEKKSSLIGFGQSAVVDDEQAVEDRAVKALESVFRPEFLNRLDKIVVFNNLTKADCEAIAELEFNKIKLRLKDKNIQLSWEPELVSFVVNEGYSEKYGARNIRRKVQEAIEDTLADKIINGEVQDGDKITLGYNYIDKRVLVSVNELAVLA